ncbi:diaminobutyrate--2-oxoglutarate transaminase [Paenibacillus sp. GYB003]|uniref:diaminobutyrate--2-oxoglutarate transaminase n=1 Tax=Paenibacillus sp. GYB003 TaxID=2994392 RepID=UPI002F96E8DC
MTNRGLLQSGNELTVFEELESEVRSYCRSFPAVFRKARDWTLWDREGNAYIDFFAGAGALNYGHNNARLKEKLIRYVQSNGISHSLDMATEAKETFLRRFRDVILRPRGLAYKAMFPGPTGANAVEAALKLARKATGRTDVVGFTNAFHGMTLGALAVTGNKFKRQGAGVPLQFAVMMPYDGFCGKHVDTTDYLDSMLRDSGSGVAKPAAVIVETLQGEGGLNAAGGMWLRKLEALCREHGMLLIVDDVQMGCGRTGPFFSFEPFGIEPDIVCLSKSIGGYGLPMSLVLMKPELDLWRPGEHNGTFRGNNLAFVCAEEALGYWETGEFERRIRAKAGMLAGELDSIVAKHPQLRAERRGRGLMQGIAFPAEGMAEAVCKAAFRRGLIMETSGTDGEVAKVMPPLTIDDASLLRGLKLLEQSVDEAAGASRTTQLPKTAGNGGERA